jgi:hypothetical protein
MLPGWNSIDSVRRIHDAAEIIGIALFGLVVLAELCQFFYGGGDGYLTEFDEQATKKQLESVKAAQQQRSLSKDQKQILVGVLSPYRGQKVSVARIMGDGEAEPLANDFVDVFVASGWVFNGKPEVVQGVYSKDPIGIEVTLNQTEATVGVVDLVLPAAGVLVTKLAELGIIDGKKAFVNPDIPVDLIEVRVGKRLPPTK